jgi:hypothetical protein
MSELNQDQLVERMYLGYKNVIDIFPEEKPWLAALFRRKASRSCFKNLYI